MSWNKRNGDVSKTRMKETNEKQHAFIISDGKKENKILEKADAQSGVAETMSLS